jgi:hypothetical protein
VTGLFRAALLIGSSLVVILLLWGLWFYALVMLIVLGGYFLNEVQMSIRRTNRQRDLEEVPIKTPLPAMDDDEPGRPAWTLVLANLFFLGLILFLSLSGDR